MKACPFCAEDIKAAAVKCKHCGSMVNGAGAHLAREAVPPPPAPPARCPSCGNAIGPGADSCARCGARLRGEPIVTERTSKDLKLQHLFACGVFVLGFVVAAVDCSASASGGGEMSPVSILLLVVGLILYVASRVRIWWHHH